MTFCYLRKNSLVCHTGLFWRVIRDLSCLALPNSPALARVGPSEAPYPGPCDPPPQALCTCTDAVLCLQGLANSLRALISCFGVVTYKKAFWDSLRSV